MMANQLTVAQIKQMQRSATYRLPTHWVTDWLLHVTGKPASFLITDSAYLLSCEEQARFDAGIKQMQSGTPPAYLIGKQAFWSLDFVVNEHTLIPRPDTEVLIEQVLHWIQSQPNSNSLTLSPFKLLDLGTGSGCIAISLAYELAHELTHQSAHQPAHQQVQRWQVTATDLSIAALKVAEHNAKLNGVDNVCFKQGSWYDALDSSGDGKKTDDNENIDDKFNVIVSNPPYIKDDDSHLDKLVAEPLSALVAKDDGLADIRHIIGQGRLHLYEGGLMAIEHGYDQGEAVRQIFTDCGYTGIQTHQDYGGNDRVTVAITGSYTSPLLSWSS